MTRRRTVAARADDLPRWIVLFLLGPVIIVATLMAIFGVDPIRHENPLPEWTASWQW